jgi:hypothetical protein
MPRATRSKKIVFLEDLTATASQIAIPDISCEAGAPLAEISNNQEENEIVESMTVEDVEMAEQLKDLKAAYKTAIGVKKNKKGRNKKKERLQLDQSSGHSQQVVDDLQPAVVSPASEGARQILNSDEGSLIFLSRMKSYDLTKSDCTRSIEVEEHTSPPSPAVRATRQLVKQQAGQYNSVLSLTAVTSLGLINRHVEHIETDSTTHSLSFSLQTKTRDIDCRTSPGQYKADISQLLAELAGRQEAKVLSQEIDKFTHMQATSPMKTGIKTLEEVEKACKENNAAISRNVETEEDSFVDKITERSPVKPVLRIEDSIEELDKLEDTIEALGQVAIAKPISPPERKKKDQTRAATVPRGRAISPASRAKTVRKAERKVTRATANAPAPVKQQETRVGAKARAAPLKEADVMKTKTISAPREVVTVDKGTTTQKKPIKRPTSLLVPKEPVKSTKPVTLPNFELPGEAVARKLKEQREARRAQTEDGPATKAVPPPAPKVKSTKPPTKPTFELPGEALSRKKREAHEARLKAQEEEEKKRREFKAKPLRKSVVPDFVPRETAASLARKSQVVNLENALAATGLPYSSLSLKVAKRGSIVGVHRPSILATNIANTSAPRSPGPSANNHSRKISTTSGPSMSGLAIQRTVSASEVQSQRQRAKEIYNRDTKALEDLEKERREREAAAKKSREEAAERGRQASREWAEKQRAKKAMQPDKGLSAGYGPGGQLGLKA